MEILLIEWTSLVHGTKNHSIYWDSSPLNHWLSLCRCRIYIYHHPDKDLSMSSYVHVICVLRRGGHTYIGVHLIYFVIFSSKMNFSSLDSYKLIHQFSDSSFEATGEICISSFYYIVGMFTVNMALDTLMRCASASVDWIIRIRIYQIDFKLTAITIQIGRTRISICKPN